MRPKREQAIKAAIHLTPQYAQFLQQIQRKDRNLTFLPEILKIQYYCASWYVRIYDDERRMGNALFLFLLGEDEYRSLNSKLEKASEAEQQLFLDEIVQLEDGEIDELFGSFEIPRTSEEWKAVQQSLENLPEEERRDWQKRSIYFWIFIFSSFFNTLSLMVHGSKLTSLVPLAVSGDDAAFLKAIQIDRMLLIHHPYFRERKLQAQSGNELEFLSKILYREANPPLRGKIRFPALYMLFGILESYQWLDDLKHGEILDIVDAAQLDRYQNRIEDVTYITKRLVEYRRWQKSNSLSMQ